MNVTPCRCFGPTEVSERGRQPEYTEKAENNGEKQSFVLLLVEEA